MQCPLQLRIFDSQHTADRPGPRILRLRSEAALALFLAMTLASCTGVIPRNSQFYLPASYNFAFYDTHPGAARSFYAAHVAHFGIYEVALTKGEDATDAFTQLEARIRRLVIDPPRFEPPADLIAPQWTKIAYPTGRSMDWTHHLHSQLYDILTDPAVTEKQAAGERAIAYYLENPDAAYSTRGYGHRWMMGGGAWAGTFPRKVSKHQRDPVVRITGITLPYTKPSWSPPPKGRPESSTG